MSTEQDLSLYVTADATGVKTGMKDAAKAVETSSAEIKASTGQMAEAAKGYFDKIVTSMRTMSTTAATSAAAVGTGMSKAATEAKEHGEKIEASIGKASKVMKLFGEIMVAGMIGEAFNELAKKTAEYGDSMERASQKTGISTDKLQQLRFAANMSDVGFDSLTMSMGRLSLKMSQVHEGTGATAAAFKAIGMSASEVKDAKIEDVLAKMADKFKGTEDGAQKMAVAMSLLGRTGSELIPWLNKGSEGIQEMMERAKELGLVLDESAIKQAAQLDDQMKEMRATNEAAALQIGSVLTPAFLAISKAFTKNLSDGGAFKTFLEGFKEFLIILAEVVSHVAQGFQEMGTMIGGAMAIINARLHGDWAAANAISAELDSDLQRMAASYNKFREDLRKPLSLPHVESGEGPKEKLKFDPGTAGKSKMGQFSAELAEAKVHYQEMQRAEGSFKEYSKEQELQFWTDKLKMTTKGSEDEKAVRLRVATQKLVIDKAAFDTELKSMEAEAGAYRHNTDVKLELAKQYAEKVKKAYGEESTQYQEAMKKINEVHRQALEQRKQADEMNVRILEARTMDMVEQEREANQMKTAMGMQTKAQEIIEEQKYEAALYAIKEKAMQEKLALAEKDPDRNPVEVAKIHAQVEQMELEHNKKMRMLNKQYTLEATTSWRGMITSMATGLTSVVKQMAQGTMTMAQGIKAMFKVVLGVVIDTLAQMAARWMVEKATEMLLGKTAATSGVAGNAAVAATAAMASVAAIPFVGWAMAPAVGAETFATAMAYEGAVMSASKGFDIPAGVNPLTQLHEKEMVLPAKEADTIRGLKDGESGGATTIHINAMDSRDVRRLFMNEGDSLVRSLKTQARNFKGITK